MRATNPENGVPERIRTSDLALRRRLLYPTELPGPDWVTARIVAKRTTGGQSPCCNKPLFMIANRWVMSGCIPGSIAVRMMSGQIFQAETKHLSGAGMLGYSELNLQPECHRPEP